MLTMVCEWPWTADPRTAALEVGGDIAGAVGFGLVNSEEELREITAMICAGLPDDAPCHAVWSVGGDILEMKVVSEVSAIKQTFVRHEQGYAVKQDFLQLHPIYYKRGHARRLARNLLILYDTLGVDQATTTANHIAGSYVWARFGARPKDPEYVRAMLSYQLGVSIRSEQIDESFREGCMEVILHTPEEDLMYEVAMMEGEDGSSIGEILLLPLSWEAYWDVRCPAFRKFIKEKLQ